MCEGLVATGGHDRQLTGGGLRGTAGNRCVDVLQSHLLQSLAKLDRVLRCHGSAGDHDRTLGERSGRTVWPEQHSIRLLRVHHQNNQCSHLRPKCSGARCSDAALNDKIIDDRGPHIIGMRGKARP